MSAPLVTPETRIGDLIAARPELVDFLARVAPAFGALKNPVLRRTVARVATVAQAARVAGMPAPELVRLLRKELGQEGECSPAAPVEDAPGRRPAWAADAAVAVRLDADALLAAGKTPIAEIGRARAGLEPGSVLLLKVSFYPAPLIDALRGQGLDVHAERSDAGGWLVFIHGSA